MVGDCAESALVMVVDDDPAWGKLAETWLNDDYRVRTALDGTEALDAYTPAVDLIFLDRQMPGLDGYEVLEALRDRGATCPVVMLTGMKPELDLVDVPFDEYLSKPVTEAELKTVADELLTYTEYHERLRELYTTVAKISTLESEYDQHELQADGRYRWLLERRDRCLEQVDDMVHELDAATAFRELTAEMDERQRPDIAGQGVEDS